MAVIDGADLASVDVLSNVVYSEGVPHDLFARLLDQLDDDARRTVIDGVTHLAEAARVAT